MKKNNVSISNPDELNKHLQHTSLFTWLSLGVVSLLLIGFFVWSSVFKLHIKITGQALVSGGEVTLNIDKNALHKLSINQSFYINGKEGTIISFNESGQPMLSLYDLPDGNYDDIAYGKRPIEFLVGK